MKWEVRHYTHSNFWNSRMLSLAKANGPLILLSVVFTRSSSVTFRNGFHTPAPVFHTATRRGEDGNTDLMEEKTEEMSEAE